jgi:hypothetical protein
MAVRSLISIAIFAGGCLACAGCIKGQTPDPLGVHVENAEFTTLMTVDVFAAIAKKYHVVIGMSGVSIGPDSLHIDVRLRDGTLRDLLDTVVREDPRFGWEMRSDGSVAVTLGATLTLPDVVVGSFDLAKVSRYEIAASIDQIPEAATWLQGSQCVLEQLIVIAGRPERETIFPEVHTHNSPVWASLNDYARKSGKYFWSLVQYTDQPCRINLHP